MSYYDEHKHDGFDREVERKQAEYYLLEAASMFKQAGFPMWYVIKMLAEFWNNLDEHRTRLQKWSC